LVFGLWSLVFGLWPGEELIDYELSTLTTQSKVKGQKQKTQDLSDEILCEEYAQRPKAKDPGPFLRNLHNLRVQCAKKK
jgi:hypothetical protein